jgi:type III secretion protein J
MRFYNVIELYPMIYSANSRYLFRLMATFLLLASNLLFTSCESSKTIVNGLEERDANEILVFLESKGINANKVMAAGGGGGGGSKIVLWDITVSDKDATQAMALLNQAGLPRKRNQNLLSIFSNVGLVPSERQDKIRYEAGLAEQIASVIRKIDGVLDADVQISFPEEDPLNPGKTKGKITASVYVKHNGILDDPNSHLITKIKRLVASSITGLDYNDVTVISDRARGSDLTTGLSSSDAEEKSYVSIWTIVLAKESVTRFRIVFFTFSLLILLMALLMIWMIWKIYPVLKAHGGIKELFHIHPLKLGALAEEEPAKTDEEKEKDKEKKPDSKDGKGLVDNEVDET